MGEIVKVLITVITYPHPSEKYLELVCTAGIKETGEFIRLYPVDYRYRDREEHYRKYQWIELEVERNVKDNRIESYRPVENKKIKILGERIPTDHHWVKRKEIVFKAGIKTMCELQRGDPFRCSLGLVKPKSVESLTLESDDTEWKPEYQKYFLELRLFGPERKPLDKIPFKFRYHFHCHDPACKGHKMIITDWEIGQLYRNIRNKTEDVEIIREKIIQKYFEDFCSLKYDLHFFVGTVANHPKSWIIIGTFHPTSDHQAYLF